MATGRFSCVDTLQSPVTCIILVRINLRLKCSMMKHAFPFPCHACAEGLCVLPCACMLSRVKCLYMYIYIPMPGGSFDVGSALSKPYARGQKLVLSSSFFSDDKVTGLASWLFWTLAHKYKSIITPLLVLWREYIHSALGHVTSIYIYIYVCVCVCVCVCDQKMVVCTLPVINRCKSLYTACS